MEEEEEEEEEAKRSREEEEEEVLACEALKKTQCGASESQPFQSVALVQSILFALFRLRHDPILLLSDKPLKMAKAITEVTSCRTNVPRHSCP